MLLGAYHDFLIECSDLKTKPQRAFLAGKITFAEACAFSTRSRLQNKSFATSVDLLHTKRHAVLVRKHEGIDLVHESVSAFADELESMPGHIARMVIDGKLTLLQARCAMRDRFGVKGVQELARANVPTVPYRARKYRLGTERSVRDPVRVRPRNRFSHQTTRG